MGEGPKASDPPDLSARRHLGQPDPSARGLPDPMEPDPKTEFHDAMVKQNSTADYKKFHSARIFLWIISKYFHMLSTYYLQDGFSYSISCSCRNCTHRAMDRGSWRQVASTAVRLFALSSPCFSASPANLVACRRSGKVRQLILRSSSGGKVSRGQDPVRAGPQVRSGLCARQKGARRNPQEVAIAGKFTR